MNCKNCGHIVQDTYCGHCGQKVNVDRITFSSLLNELTESVFQVNKGFFLYFNKPICQSWEKY